MNYDVCDVTCIHTDKVNRVRKQLTEQPIADMAKLYKLLGEKNRLHIACSLLLEEELCVCDIANIIGATTASASHHLRQLHKAGLVTYRKAGRRVYYSLKDEYIKTLLQRTFTQIKEHSAHAV
ncbi:MAG TPA: metalloregulator ArsR/SmtB family transcription factor [Bacillota bacterium]|nr:metalloregulator ArsR/SmtB family transcription factor [Bacillota bacterium]